MPELSRLDGMQPQPTDRPLRIAVLTLDYRSPENVGGGVAAVTDFVLGIGDRHPELDMTLVALPSSSRDSGSRRLRDPRSLLRRSIHTRRAYGNRLIEAFGANAVEWEPLRYAPRRELTSYLRQFDVVQVVSGSPALALCASRANRPVLLQTATFVRFERAIRVRESPLDWLRGLNLRIVDRMDRRALRTVSEVFVENTIMLNEVCRFVEPDNVQLAPPGVDTEVFTSPAGRVAAAGPDSYFLTVSRLDDPRKNVAVGIRAFAEFKQTGGRVAKFVLAGRRPPRDRDLRLARQLGVADDIEVISPVSEAELIALYQGATAFVLPSSEEGLGLVLLEAMACGAPVISTRTAGAEFVVERTGTGLLCDLSADDGATAAELARAMRQLALDSDLARAMSRHGREGVVRHFSVAATERAYVGAYRRLANRSPAVAVG